MPDFQPATNAAFQAAPEPNRHAAQTFAAPRQLGLGAGHDSVILDAKLGGLSPWKIRRLKAFIEGNLARSIRVADLSKVVGLSVSHFSRAFLHSFGDPPHVYLVRRRLDRARHLMLATDLPLSEVAVACGFSDQAHFCNLFRRNDGEAPAAWRRRRRAIASRPQHTSRLASQ